MRPDMIDPASITWYGTNPLGWAATVELDGVECNPHEGVIPLYDRPTADLRWPDKIPPGWDGPVQFTLCAIVRVNGRWYGGPFMLFWRGRRNTGANWLEPAPDGPRAGTNNWQANWAYDGAWGEMQHYVPKEGDEIGICLAAGGIRKDEAGTVHERTPIVRLPLVRRGIWQRTDVEIPPTPPTTPDPPTPPTPPLPPVPPAPPTPELTSALLQIGQTLTELSGLLRDLSVHVTQEGTATAARLTTIEGLLEKPPIYDLSYLGPTRVRRDAAGRVVRG